MCLTTKFMKIKSHNKEDLEKIQHPNLIEIRDPQIDLRNKQIKNPWQKVIPLKVQELPIQWSKNSLKTSEERPLNQNDDSLCSQLWLVASDGFN